MVYFGRLLLFLFMIGVFGCDDRVDKYELKASYEGSNVVVRVDKNILSRGETHAIVPGHILISSEKKIVSINLSCFQLHIDGVTTERIYVDSPAHFNAEMILANDSGVVDLPVYWAINGVHEDRFERIGLSIIGAGCITYVE